MFFLAAFFDFFVAHNEKLFKFAVYIKQILSALSENLANLNEERRYGRCVPI